MFDYLKFSLGNMCNGYKVIRIESSMDSVAYEIIHCGLLSLNKVVRQKTNIADWLTKWESFDISSWEEEYIDNTITSPEEWRLEAREGNITYKISGSGAYPQKWTLFLEWLDELMPEMEFISPNRIESICLSYEKLLNDGVSIRESICIDRKEKNIYIKKDDMLYPSKSTHIYDIGDGVDTILTKFQDCNFTIDVPDVDKNPKISLKISRHALPDIHIGSILLWNEWQYKEHDYWGAVIGVIKDYMPGLKMFVLSYNTYCPDTNYGKYIYCKVRFGTSSKLYSYRTEDSTLKVGDVVDVPVGSEGNVSQATIEDIGYYDKENAPYPPEKTKFIIGKHNAGNSQLTIECLRQILVDNDVYKGDYSLSEDEPCVCEVTLCLRKRANDFEYYIYERNVKRDVEIFNTEDEACRALLSDMTSDYPALKKYIKED